MKRYIKALLLAASSIFCAVACVDEQEKMTAVMLSDSAVKVPAAENDKVITVYADGSWKVDVTEDWLYVSPSSGSGTAEVTIHSDYNSAEEARTGKVVVLCGNTTLECEVTQKGDLFKNALEYTVSELKTVEAGTRVKVKQSQVAGLSQNGFVVCADGEAIYVEGDNSALVAGDYVTLTGQIDTLNSILGLVLEDPTVVSTGNEVVYPEAVELTGPYGAYRGSTLPEQPQYVTFDGGYTGSVFTIDDVTVGAPYDVPDNLLISNYSLHYVGVTAWYVGVDSDGNAAFLVLSLEDAGMMAKVVLEFEIETSDFKSKWNSTWVSESYFGPVTGDGSLSYVPCDLESTNGNNKYVLDISANDPRVTGPFAGDYWLIYAEDAVKSGSTYQVKFGARVSGTGPRYWALEYLDGKTWKMAGTVLEADTNDKGTVQYTHKMNSDGATNISIDEKFTFERNVDHLQVRFRAVSNLYANAETYLTVRNGGSARLAIGSVAPIPSQPMVLLIEEGDGSATDPVDATITISEDHLSFDGIPAGSKTIDVTSDFDFSISADANWLHFDPETGLAGEKTTITVTADTSSLSTIREAYITVLSNETTKSIPVVQGAAGQEIEPFISLVGSNSVTVLGQGESFSTKVQSNVSFEVEICNDWITAEETVATTSLVETVTRTYTAAPNLTGEDRVGKIRFYNGDIETVLTVNQAQFEPKITVSTAASAIGVSGLGGSVNYTITSNVDFTVSADSWITLPVSEAIAGEYTVPIQFAANTSSEARTGTVTFKNEAYGYTYEYTVKQFADGVYFFDDFNWLIPVIETATETVGDSMSASKDAGTPNAYTKASGFAEALAAQGYVDLAPSFNAIYLQTYYLQFSLNKKVNGIQLPQLSSLTESADVTLTFDWGVRSGTGGPDAVVLEVVVEGNGTVVNGSAIEHTQVKGEAWEWKSETITITGLDADSKIKIRPTDFTGTATSSSLYRRWYIDNVKISK